MVFLCGVVVVFAAVVPLPDDDPEPAEPLPDDDPEPAEPPAVLEAVEVETPYMIWLLSPVTVNCPAVPLMISPVLRLAEPDMVGVNVKSPSSS